MTKINHKYTKYNIARQELLNRLYSVDKECYKRRGACLMSYMGGKSNAVGEILELFPRNIDTLISPFCGGSSVELACSQEIGYKVYAYDTNELLINFYREAKHNNEEFSDLLEKFCLIGIKEGKPFYDKSKDILLDNNSDISNLEKAVRLYIHMRTGFSGLIGATASNSKIKHFHTVRSNKIRNYNFDNIEYELLSFEKSIPKHNGKFIYADPPYYMNKDDGIQHELYPNHKQFNHDLLAKLLKKHKGGFVLSYNDCKYVREKYKKYKMIVPEWKYRAHGFRENNELLIVNNRE